MKKSDLYKLIDSYVLESNVLDAKIRQIIKEELLNLVSGYSSSKPAVPQYNTNTVVPSFKNESRTPQIKTPSVARPKIAIDRNTIIERMQGDFEKVGNMNGGSQPIVVPGTQGMITMDEEDMEDFGDEGAGPSVMDNVLKGKSTGNPLLDKILTVDYSGYVQRTNKNKK